MSPFLFHFKLHRERAHDVEILIFLEIPFVCRCVNALASKMPLFYLLIVAKFIKFDFILPLTRDDEQRQHRERLVAKIYVTERFDALYSLFQSTAPTKQWTIDFLQNETFIGWTMRKTRFRMR